MIRASSQRRAKRASDVGARAISGPRKLLSGGLLTFGCLTLFMLDQTDIVMNASHSLDEPAYLMLEHPILLGHGTVVSAQMPDVLQAKFEGLHFVKRIGGLPGEEITRDEDGAPCVVGYACYPGLLENGIPIAPLLKPGIIPEGHYAVFGTSKDSLDSRYAVIGFISKDRLLGRGWPIPFMPDWRK
jgi:hypothetical protein